jgi:hypothetical protein
MKEIFLMSEKMSFKDELKSSVECHSILQNEWLLKRKKRLSKNDLILWLSQEYFVSVEFVNWFLWTAALSKDIDSKIILVENIWEELGEGKKEDSHVMILIEFLKKLSLSISDIKILSYTQKYLDKMRYITNHNFFSALGALGPANEYLLKLEYGMMYESYQVLKKENNLPEGKFFQINLTADLTHSEKLFSLIEKVCDNEEKRDLVRKGNLDALEARDLFYKGLLELD